MFNNDTLSPIVVFTYNRLDLLKKTIEALQKCYLSKESELIIFSDGAKNQEDLPKIKKIRNYIKNIKGFKKISWHFYNNNKGLANSIIKGINITFQSYNKVIVLEDDLLPSSNFLVYMNQALQTYSNVNNVMSISGYTSPISCPKGYNFDNYFTQRASSWGWATWKEKWINIDWHVKDYKEFSKNRIKKKKFNQMGSDLSNLLDKQMSGSINSWAIRWCYHQFKNDLYTVFPMSSKIDNIGFTDEATHTKGNFNRFKTNIDKSGKTKFNFLLTPQINKNILKQFTKVYGLKSRIFSKLNKYLAR